MHVTECGAVAHWTLSRRDGGAEVWRSTERRHAQVEVVPPGLWGTRWGESLLAIIPTEKAVEQAVLADLYGRAAGKLADVSAFSGLVALPSDDPRTPPLPAYRPCSVKLPTTTDGSVPAPSEFAMQTDRGLRTAVRLSPDNLAILVGAPDEGRLVHVGAGTPAEEVAALRYDADLRLTAILDPRVNAACSPIGRTPWVDGRVRLQPPGEPPRALDRTVSRLATTGTNPSFEVTPPLTVSDTGAAVFDVWGALLGVVEARPRASGSIDYVITRVATLPTGVIFLADVPAEPASPAANREAAQVVGELDVELEVRTRGFKHQGFAE